MLTAALAGMACAIAVLASSQPAWGATAGSIDTSFGTGGYSTVALGTWAGAASVAVQPDGKIITAGQAEVSGENVIVVTRMTTSGALDPSFGTGGITTVHINGGAGMDSGAALVLQPDGRIVLAGSGNQTVYGPMSFAAVRLTPSGALDPSFGIGGVTTVRIGQAAIANALVLQPDGKLVLAGTALQGHNELAAARLTSSGALDSSFGTAGIVTVPETTGGAWGLARQDDGKLILAGQADYNNPAVTKAQQFMAVRLNVNGTRDTGFGQDGTVLLPVGATALGFGVAIQTTGKIVLDGIAFTTTGVNAAARLNPNGSLDRTFGVGGIATIADWNGSNGIVLDGSDRIVMPAVGASAVVMNANGSIASDFGTGGIALVNSPAGGANGAAIQSDGKIVLAGAATVNGHIVISVIRLQGMSSPAPPPKTTTTTATTTTSKRTTTTPKAGPRLAAVGRAARAVRCAAPAIVRARRHTKPRPRRTRRSRAHHLLTRRLSGCH